MTKPRFTPDPVPDGLDPDLAAYLQRQFDRINDWWPEDYDLRVKTLETLTPGVSGTWPIVDYGYFSVGAVQAAVPVVLKGFVYEGGQAFFTQTDYEGFDWDNPNTSVSLSQTGGWVTDGNGNILAQKIGTAVVYSTNGTDFTTVALPDGDTGSITGGVAYVDPYWYAVGVGTVGEGQPFKCWRSSDMINWTEIYEETDSAKIPWRPPSGYGLCLDSSNNLCAITEKVADKDHHFRKSTDGGLTWSFVDINDLSGWSVGWIKNINGKLVVTGNRMTLMWSDDDGASWNTPIQLASSEISTFSGDMAYGNGRYVWGENKGTGFTMWTSTNIGSGWSDYSGFKSQGDSIHFDDDLGFIWTLGGSVKISDTGLDGSWTEVGPTGFSLAAIGLYIYKAPLTL